MPPRTVLVVDAAPLTADRVQEALAGTGLGVRAAADPVEAEERLDDDVAVVLAAMTFPRGNGYDLARRVRGRRPEAVVFLLCGGFEVYNADRAAEAGVTGRIARPFTADGLRRHLEGALGPLSADAPPADPERIDPYDGPLLAAVEAVPEPRTAVGDERLASFIPRDWKTHPPVRVDPEQVSPAMERAILEVLPEVVEAVMDRALRTSPAFRELLAVAVDEAVRAQIGAVARRAVRERLAEIEAAGEDAG